MAMTARQVYEGVLIEMNKVQAPSMLLEDFNYFINKAVNQYINKKYNVYDVNQQSTDDLRVLKATQIVNVNKTTKYGNNISGNVTGANSMYGATYEAMLPQDYLHMLNCICNFKVKKQFKCYDPNTYVQFGATRLTADLWGQIINNFYMKPSYKKPYYYLHNVNPATGSPISFSNQEIPTNPVVTDSNGFYTDGTDMNTNKYDVHPGYVAVTGLTAWESGVDYYTRSGNAGNYTYTLVDQSTTSTPVSGTTYYKNDTEVISQEGNSNFPRKFKLSNNNVVSLIEKPTAQRIANPSGVRIEIRVGKDDSIFELESVYIDYVKSPQYIRLTQEQIDLTEDTSQIMEFPDYVCQEIINELTHLIMENSSDPRLQSHMPISMSIANPAQASTNEQSK